MARSSKRTPPTNPDTSSKNTDNQAPHVEISDTSRGYYHRIVCGEIVGGWATYQGIALLKVGSVVYHHATDFFHGSLPTEQIFVTKVV